MIKTVHINANHDDRYSVRFELDSGEPIKHEGYALHMDGLGGGSYTRMAIDNATGQIIGWVPLTEEAIAELMDE